MSEDASTGELRATLAISQEEASNGTERTLTLPGARRINFYVPAGAYQGQQIRIPGQGDTTPQGIVGDLVITLSIVSSSGQTDPNNEISSSAQSNFPTIASSSSPSLLSSGTPPPSSYPSSAGSYSSTPGLPPTVLGSPPPPYPTATTNHSSNPGYATNQNQPYYATPAPSPSLQSTPPYYNNQTANSQPAYYSAIPQIPTSPPAKRSTSAPVLILVVLLVIVLLGGSALFLYTGVYLPNQANSNATATAHVKNAATETLVAQNQLATTQANQQTGTAVGLQQATTTAIAQATASVVAQHQNDYTNATKGTPALDDNLHNQSGSNWDSGTNCFFSNNAYHASSSVTKQITPCFATGTNFDNFAFQVHMKILNGDAGGVLFRGNANSYRTYLLTVTSSGYYYLYYYPDGTGTSSKQIIWNSSSAIKTGSNQENIICVINQGADIKIYINGTYIVTTQDSSLNSGSIGVIADDTSNSTEVVYTQAQVWKL